MHRREIGRPRSHQGTMEHTGEGPDMFPAASLSDGSGVDGGGHGTEGKDEE